MELKSLVLGLVFSIGVFAIKSGAGLSYLFRQKSGLGGRLICGLGFSAAYGVVFALSWLLARHMDFTSWIERLYTLFKSGMCLHFIVAILLLVWGTALLSGGGSSRRGTGKPGSTARNQGQSRAWLLLSLPCPVCFSVIFLTGAFLQGLMPDEPLIFLYLYAGFITLSLLAAVALSVPSTGSPEQWLGAVMVMAALYFLVSMAVVPHFSDARRVYRISLGSAEGIHRAQHAWLSAGAALTFVLGFLRAGNAGRQKWI